MGVRQLSCFCIATMLLLQANTTLAVSNMFNLHLLETKHTPSAGISVCKDRGYDGLAVLSSPEAYDLALKITAPNRTAATSRVAVGLLYHANPRSIRWADGTLVADDMPWEGSTPTPSGHKPHGRIITNGNLIMTANTHMSPILCGSYYTKEAKGETRVGQQPDMQSSSLASKETGSYMKCVVLCVTDGRCRAAEFNSDLLTCITFGAGMFSGFAANDATTSFVRRGY